MQRESRNSQKIYPVNAPEYEAITTLFVLTGHSLPSTTGPWSADELLEMMDKLNPEEIPASLKSLYDDTYQSLSETPKLDLGAIGLTFSGDVNIEAYIHTNTKGFERTVKSGKEPNRDSDDIEITEKAFVGEQDWVYKYIDEKPFFRFNTEMWATKHFYAIADIDIDNNYHAGEKYESDLGCTPLTTNIFMLKNPLKGIDLGNFNCNWPDRAFISAGGSNWNIMFGRDRLSWGAGQTGNLTISDNISRHEFLKFTTYSKSFKYTFLASFYTHPMNYWDDNTAWGALNTHYNDENAEGIKMYTAHRFEWRLFKDKLTLGVTEGLMYMSQSAALDIRALNPFNFNHNNYIANNTNSTLEFEADYTPIKGLNIYAQFMIDQIAFFGETKPSKKDRATPNAFGYLVGASYLLPLNNIGLFKFAGEFAYTDPYLYLRDGGLEDTGYGIDYVVSVRNWVSPPLNAITYDEYVLGYTYGPDSIVWNLNAGWTSRDQKLKVEGNFFGMVHGTHDIWTKWQKIGGDNDTDFDKHSSTPTTKDSAVNSKYGDQAQRDSASTTLVFGLNASYQILPSLSVMTQLDFVTIKNYANRSSAPLQKDFQVVVGASYSF